MIHEIIIIGSGIAGTSAALKLSQYGIKPLILDVGYTAERKIDISENIYDYRKSNDIFDILIGENLEGLINILENKNYPPKLTAPLMNYVIKNVDKLSHIKSTNFTPIQSFSMGGLANAWGAGVYKYNNYELKDNQIKSEDLEKYYEELTEEIGISGKNDDLTKYCGFDKKILPELKISKKSQKVLYKYNKNQKKYNKKGIFIGYPRLAVLSKEYKNRRPCDYSNFETWINDLDYIYTPKFTLERLVNEKKVIYEKNVLVDSWIRDKDNNIIIKTFNLKTKTYKEFKAKKLILAAGTINTAKIILKSNNDYNTELTLLDNPLFQIPLIFPQWIGSKIEKNAFGLTQLNIIFDFREQIGEILQGSIIELSSPPRAAFHKMFPLSIKGNITLMREIIQATMVLFLYLPSNYFNETRLKLNKDNSLTIVSSKFSINKEIKRLILKGLKNLGFITSSLLINQSDPGYAIHYAGTIPMKKSPSTKYETDLQGELYKNKNIFIVDGSLFSYIASKNLSFTIMANSMRIADNIAKRIKNERK